jgi:hypothetical protein
MKLSDSAKIPVQVMARDLGNDVVILDLASGTYFGLDTVGARIWNYMGEGKTLTEICDKLTEEFDVSREQLERDILNLAEDLETKRLITVASV